MTQEWTERCELVTDARTEPVLGGPVVYSRDGRWRWTGETWARRDPDAA
jgi:hypothetical protein